MTWKPCRTGRGERLIAKHEAARERRIARRTGAAAASAQDGLLRAAKNGPFEALVAQARPAQPIKMVTPEEREAELRAAGQWPEDKPRPEPNAEPPAGMLWAEEHIRWRPRGPSDLRSRHEPGQCLVEYDPIEYFYAELDEED